MSPPPELPQSYVNLTPGDPAPGSSTSARPAVRILPSTRRRGAVSSCAFRLGRRRAGPRGNAKRSGQPQAFDDIRCSFFGVSLDPQDEAERRVSESIPGIRFLLGFEWGREPSLRGHPERMHSPTQRRSRRAWIVLDPTLRVLRVIPLATDGSDTIRGSQRGSSYCHPVVCVSIPPPHCLRCCLLRRSRVGVFVAPIKWRRRES